MKMFGNERGAALIVALMMLCFLTLIGTIVANQVRTDLEMVNAMKAHKQSFYSAEGGINIAEADIENLTSDTSNWNDPNWELWIDEDDYPGCDIPYDVKISHYLIGGQVAFWGDTNGDFDFELNFSGVGTPIERIEAYGYDGPPGRMAESLVEVMVKREPIILSPLAPLHFNGSFVKDAGASGSCIAEKYPGCSASYDIISTPNAEAGHGGELFRGDTGFNRDILENGPEYPVDLVASRLLPIATEVPLDNNDVCGDPYNPGIFKHTGSTDVNNIDGYGVLVIDGDFSMAGNVTWHGILIVTGSLEVKGGGHKAIHGASLVGEDFTCKGSVDMWYDCDWITNSLGNGPWIRMIWARK